jgi:hypothetical protein
MHGTKILKSVIYCGTAVKLCNLTDWIVFYKIDVRRLFFPRLDLKGRQSSFGHINWSQSHAMDSRMYFNQIKYNWQSGVSSSEAA